MTDTCVKWEKMLSVYVHESSSVCLQPGQQGALLIIFVAVYAWCHKRLQDTAGYWGYLTALWEVQHSRHRCTTLLQMLFPEDDILSESYCHFEQYETAMVFVYRMWITAGIDCGEGVECFYL